MSDVASRLKITALEVMGNMGCHLSFVDGINIIKGENSLGKTTALKLISHVFKTKTVPFIKEIDDCEAVHVQVSLNNKVYEIKRSLHDGKTKASVKGVKGGYLEFPVKKAVEFLLLELQIPLYYVPHQVKRQSKSSSDSFTDLFGVHHIKRYIDPLLVSFSDLFGLMYVPQGVGGTEIQEKVSNREEKRMQRAVSETLLKLSGVNLLELEAKEAELRAKKQEIEDEINRYKTFLKELNIPSTPEIHQKIKMIEEERAAKLKEREILLQKMHGDPEIIAQLKQEIIELDYHIRTFSEDIAFLEEKVKEYRLSFHDIINEQDKLRRYGTSNAVLSSFTFSQCPRCQQPIEDDMQARETHNECMLCGRQIQTETSVNLLKRLDDLADEARELRQLIQRYDAEIATKKTQRETLFHEKALKDRALDEQMGTNYTSAFVSNVEKISHTLASLDEHIRQQQNWLTVQAKQDERRVALEKVEGQLRDIRKQIKDLESRKTADSQKFYDFEKYLHEFLDGLYRDFKFVTLDRETYMPLVNGLEYTRGSGVQINLVVLGYHYALLRYSLRHESNYPRFLMIDTPNKGDMGANIYDAMMRKFGELRQENVPFQLIIATREIPEDMQIDNMIPLNRYLLERRQLKLI